MLPDFCFFHTLFYTGALFAQICNSGIPALLTAIMNVCIIHIIILIREQNSPFFSQTIHLCAFASFCAVPALEHRFGQIRTELASFFINLFNTRNLVIDFTQALLRLFFFCSSQISVILIQNSLRYRFSRVDIPLLLLGLRLPVLQDFIHVIEVRIGYAGCFAAGI